MLKSAISILISTELKPLEDLNSIVGTRCNSGNSIGDLLSPRNPDSSVAKRSYGTWNITKLSDNHTLEDGLNLSVDFIKRISKNLENELDEYEIMINCLIESDNGQGSEILSHSILTALSNLNASLVLDFYS